MLLSYLKKIALFGIISILFTSHISSQSLAEDRYLKLCPDGQIPVLRDVRNPSSFVTCISEEILDYNFNKFKKLREELGNDIRLASISEKDYYELLKHHSKKKQIIEWFVIGFIIITIMSLPINILWRFRLRIPALLFAIMTALVITAIPYMYDMYDW
ncbi:hypothetical protein [Bartonella sp. AC158YNML]|uniref:hypothetical protein n=1 Tax=Bartonella sp. AC158YNML TaxID=3243450 RepID=UPI0035D02CD0